MTGSAGPRALRLGPACAVRRRMNARTRVPIAAVIGALVLNASAAHGQTTAPDVPSSSEAPQGSVPSSSDEPQGSVPTPEPGAETKPVVPDSIWQDDDPDSAPAGATPQPYRPPPRMIHERRGGFFLAGTIVFGATYALQLLAAFAVTVVGSGDGQCDSSCSNQAGLALLPIAGPWLSDGTDPHHGSRTPDLIFGGIEAAGLAMLIVGLYGHDVLVGPPPEDRNLTFLPFVTPQAEGLSMAMRW